MGSSDLDGLTFLPTGVFVIGQIAHCLPGSKDPNSERHALSQLHSDPPPCRITALLGCMVAGAVVNPADQRWGFWPLLPLSSQLVQLF